MRANYKFSWLVPRGMSNVFSNNIIQYKDNTINNNLTMGIGCNKKYICQMPCLGLNNDFKYVMI